jgi:hypothetical protein
MWRRFFVNDFFVNKCLAIINGKEPFMAFYKSRPKE